MSKIYFVVDTEQYSGNFERGMCAYMTGLVGECKVGDDLIHYFDEEVEDGIKDEIQSIIDEESDDHGCNRPVKAYPTEGWFNDGNGNHYKNTDATAHFCKRKYPAYQSVAICLNEKPSQNVIDVLKERALKYGGENRMMEFAGMTEITVIGFRLITITSNTETQEL
jgi:hypothetical protein